MVLALSPFSYSPLVWIFYGRDFDHRIDRVHEKALRIAYKNYRNCLDFFLEQTKSVLIHNKFLQILMNEIYKTKCSINPPFMKDIFVQRNVSYNLRHGSNAQLLKA